MAKSFDWFDKKIYISFSWKDHFYTDNSRKINLKFDLTPHLESIA